MDTVLPSPETLHLVSLIAELHSIRAVVRPKAKQSRCPCCGHASDRVHSWYRRTLLDLPWHGVPLRLELHVRRFFCDTLTCDRRIFTERLPDVVAPYAHRTHRLDTWFTLVGFALGGEAGVRLLRQLGATSSPDTLLRHIRAVRACRQIPILPLASMNLGSDGTHASAPLLSTWIPTRWWIFCLRWPLNLW